MSQISKSGMKSDPFENLVLHHWSKKTYKVLTKDFLIPLQVITNSFASISSESNYKVISNSFARVSSQSNYQVFTNYLENYYKLLFEYELTKDF